MALSPSLGSFNRVVLPAHHLVRTIAHFVEFSTSFAINLLSNSSDETMLSNTAAWLTAEKVTPFEVKPAPIWKPLENEILVKNHALAINPVDGYIQALAFFPMEYPTILGHDIAGEVVEVGPNVTRFKKGDRVVGQALGVPKNVHEAGNDQLRETAFQSYTILKTHLTSEIPDNVSYDEAAVIPCCLSTAACGLFQETPYLQMKYPTEPAQKPTGKTVLIWGGSSSVGSNGIQLAVAAGYEVICTASSKNFEYTQKLGASLVFDYNSPFVVQDIIKACKDKTMAGVLDCIGPPATAVCMEIIQKLDGNRTVATVKPEPKEIPHGVTAKFVMGASLEHNAVGPGVWTKYLPKALKAGKFVPAPKPLIVGKGLEALQEGVDLIQKGVSAQKLVVLL